MFLLLVFLIVCVLYSRTCLSFVVAFIAENRQLFFFFFFDALKNFMLKKKNLWTKVDDALDSITDTWLSQCLSSRENREQTCVPVKCNASVTFHGIVHVSHLVVETTTMVSLCVGFFVNQDLIFFYSLVKGTRSKEDNNVQELTSTVSVSSTVRTLLSFKWFSMHVSSSLNIKPKPIIR